MAEFVALRGFTRMPNGTRVLYGSMNRLGMEVKPTSDGNERTYDAPDIILKHRPGLSTESKAGVGRGVTAQGFGKDTECPAEATCGKGPVRRSNVFLFNTKRR